MSFDIKSFLRTLPEKPGVYRMLDENGTVIYVGKARSLRKRVKSYFTLGIYWFYSEKRKNKEENEDQHSHN